MPEHNKSNEGVSFCVGIVGGGIGGLAAAVSLSRAGHEVTVYEAASKISEVYLIDMCKKR